MPVERSEGSGAIVITGKAIDGYRCKILKSAIDLRVQGIKMNRNFTIDNLREMASQYTGKKYARSIKGLKQASDDLYWLMEGKSLDEIGREEVKP